MYLQNKYTSWYFSIINRAIVRKTCGVFEKHHILPKCMGGNDDSTNIVKLTPREHFICHRLLVKMVNDKHHKAKLSYAVWQITKRYKISSRTYEELKKQLSKNTSGIPKTEQHKLALRKPKSSTENMKGGNGRLPGFKNSDETKEKISVANSGKRTGENNPFYNKKHSEEQLQKYRDMFTGIPLSADHKANISKSLKGKPTWNKGVAQPRVCCCLCGSEVDRSNLSKHYDSKKCKNNRNKSDYFL